MLNFRVSNHNVHTVFLNFPTLLGCIDLEISTWWALRKVGWYKTFYKQGAWYYSGNRVEYCGDTLFITMLIFVIFGVEWLAL